MADSVHTSKGTVSSMRVMVISSHTVMSGRVSVVAICCGKVYRWSHRSAVTLLVGGRCSLEKRRFNTRHEVGSRGFFYCSSFDSLYSLYRLVPSRRHEQEALETGIVRACLQERTESGAKRIGKRQRSSPELHACTTQQPDLLTTDTNYL